MTGEEIKKVAAVSAADLVSAGGVKWSYRRAEGNPEQATANRHPTIFVHGAGSSSYSYRTTMALLAEDGYTCIAPDFPGHGASEKPEEGTFDFKKDTFIAAFDAFVEEVGLEQPINLVVQGYIFSQYALLWAAQNEDKINAIVMLNMPLSTKATLRSELAGYVNPVPFLRTKPDAKFAGDMFAATGSAYAMDYAVAQAYDLPYQESPAASRAVCETVQGCDFKQLLMDVDEAYLTWRKPTLLVFGNKDPFVKINTVFDFLESKRTNMVSRPVEAKLGHAPQEDYPEAMHELLRRHLDGEVVQDYKMARMPPKEQLSN